MEPVFSLLSSASHPQQGPAVGRGSAAASCTTRGLHALVAKHSRLIKAARKDGPEMKHIPLSTDLCLQKRRGKFICAGVKLYRPSPPIAMRSKVSRLPSSSEKSLLMPGAKGTLQIRQQVGLCRSQGEMRCRVMEIPFHPFGLEFPWPLLGQRDGGGPWQRHCSRSVQTHTRGCIQFVPIFSPSPAVQGAGISLANPGTQPLEQRAEGAAREPAAQDGLCRVPQLVQTAATAGMGRTENITRVGFAAPQQRPSFCPGNLGYKPQLENRKKKWKYETMA